MPEDRLINSLHQVVPPLVARIDLPLDVRDVCIVDVISSRFVLKRPQPEIAVVLRENDRF